MRPAAAWGLGQVDDPALHVGAVGQGTHLLAVAELEPPALVVAPPAGPRYRKRWDAAGRGGRRRPGRTGLVGGDGGDALVDTFIAMITRRLRGR
jgi:hypothetical protein